MGGRPAGGPRESRERRKVGEDEQRGEYRWEDTLEVKVTEVSRKGSGWEGLMGGVGGALAGCAADTVVASEALWVTVCGEVVGAVWPSAVTV